MSFLEISDQDQLFFLHTPPQSNDLPTFVFVNALTGNTDAWEAIVAPTLRAQGFGTLSYNFRGQNESTFSPDLELTPDLIVDDLVRLMDHCAPQKPILVGLSIGGLFAAQAILRGMACEGLVLLNTLRKIGPRIAWVNDAMSTIVGAGGVGLFLDALFPLLVNEDFAKTARPNFLDPSRYEPLDPGHGHLNLMTQAARADWDIDYTCLDMPVHVITGLQDRVFLDMKNVDELFAKLPNGSREDWQDTGHLVPLEQPERLAEVLASFAARCGAR